ncbi:hypothetical protein AB0E27_31285 [Streptomyces sparsogenes]|uniref:hypothetical protein n=1 Tax=Streptomyces sparsogenes TaxID=67365 RepID=UPI0034116A65
MARERDGWEYLYGRPRWAPTVEIAMAQITTGLYGHEYEELRRQLEDLVRAAQREAAERLYEEYCRSEGLDLGERTGLSKAADLIFPDYPEESDSE